tara:strand:+ start:597 stop:710 length:114 start_codon:yes stop_codon:yes gene_type:complete
MRTSTANKNADEIMNKIEELKNEEKSKLSQTEEEKLA